VLLPGSCRNMKLRGLPISPQQISVLGLGGIKEQSPTPTLTLNGMPASPHQIAVLQPRTKPQIADESTSTALRTETDEARASPLPPSMI
jgi:hypothetical protein